MNCYGMNIRKILCILSARICVAVFFFPVTPEFWNETRFETFEIRELISREDALTITSQFRIIRNYWLVKISFA